MTASENRSDNELHVGIGDAPSVVMPNVVLASPVDVPATATFSSQVLEQLRMFVQESEQVDHRRQRRGFPALVARECVMSATRKARGGSLAQAQLAPDAFDFAALPFAVAQHQSITRRGIKPRAVRV